MGTQDPNIYLSGQGKLYIGPVGGFIGVGGTGFRWVGNVPSLVLALATETLEHKESFTAQRQVDFRLQTSKSITATFTLEDFKKENMALALYGVNVEDTTGSVVAEDLGTPDIDELVPLAHQGITVPVVEDSLAAALTLDTHYRIEAEHGAIVFLDQTGFTGPYNIDYTHETRDQTGIFTEAPPERMLLFHGLNTADGNKPVKVELYRVQLNPITTLPLIQDDVAQFEVSGQALLDTARPAGAALGQSGRIIQTQPV